MVEGAEQCRRGENPRQAAIALMARVQCSPAGGHQVASRRMADPIRLARRDVPRTRSRVGVRISTARRYVNETVALLAAQPPEPAQALWDEGEVGRPYVVIDCTLISIDRLATDGPVLLGQAPPSWDEPAGHRILDGEIVSVSEPLAAAVHDLTAARIWGPVGNWRTPG